MKWTNEQNKLLLMHYPCKKDDELEIIFNRERSTIRRQASTLKIKKTYRSPVIEWHPEESRALFYILGVLEGDGYVERYTPYKIALGVTDESFVKEFYKALEMIGLKPSDKAIYVEQPQHRKNSFEGRKQLYRLRVYSKSFSNWYWDIFDYGFILKNIFKEEYMLSFLKGMFESEGHLDKKTLRARMGNTNKELLELCKIILENYGFHPTMILGSNEGNLPYYYLTINRRLETTSFIDKINPCIERKAI
jgi:hypothetical protein